MDAFEVDVQPLGERPRHRHRRRIAALALVAALVVTVVALVGTGTIRLDRTVAAHRDRIAYVDETGALAAIGADGGGLRAYPVPGSTFEFPAWSPDGTRIAGIGIDGAKGGIYVFEDGGTGTSPSTPAPVVVYPPSSSVPIYLYWSPDGTRIGFLTSEVDGLALRVVAADGSAPAVVVQQGQPMYWDWVDDAHLLVHRGAAGPDAFLGEVGLDASPSPDSVGKPGEFQAPGVAAGGADRAFVASGAGGARVVVESRDAKTRFETPVAGASSIGWSPAGDQLAFTAPASASGAPYGALDLMDARSGAVRTVLDGLVVAYFWSPDGRTIAAIRIVPAGGPTAANTPTSTISTLNLAFVDVASGGLRHPLDIRLSDLVVSQFLPFFDQYALSHRVWSAAGDAIVLPLVDDTGRAHVTIVPLDGSPPRGLIDGVAGFWSP